MMQEALHLISERGIGEKMFRFNDFSTFTNLIIKNLSPALFYVFKGDLKRSDQVAIRMDLLRRQKLRGKI